MQSYSEAKKILDNAMLIYSSKDIALAIDELAEKLNHHYKDVTQPVIALPIMNGGLILSGHLISKLKFPVEIDYCHATRYRNKTTGDKLQWRVKPQLSLTDRRVLIIDDIYDEGHTLESVIAYCKTEGAEVVSSVVLVEKNHSRPTAKTKCDFVGLEVDDYYVFGFGMDYKGYHRNLDAIYAVSGNDNEK